MIVSLLCFIKNFNQIIVLKYNDWVVDYFRHQLLAEWGFEDIILFNKKVEQYFYISDIRINCCIGKVLLFQIVYEA